jgi:hypothetical protein
LYGELAAPLDGALDAAQAGGVDDDLEQRLEGVSSQSRSAPTTAAWTLALSSASQVGVASVRE